MHSPFVFSFINNILEQATSNSPDLTQKIANFYSKYRYKIDISNNSGAGSVAFEAGFVPSHQFIKKVGISKKYGKILQKLCVEYKIQKVIELGTSLGISTSYFANNKEIKVISVDANNEVLQLTKEAFNSLAVSNVEFINASFDDVLAELCKDSLEYTLIFIDGDHNKASTIRYFNTCLPFIKPNTIVVFDDIYWSEGMTAAWKEIYARQEVRLSLDLYRIGIVFFREEQLKKEHFTIWH